MLSDLHLHLRPDDPDASAEEYYSAANAERYREVALQRGIGELGVSEHVYRFTQALEIWRHPLWESYAHDDLDAYCLAVREQTDLQLGLEVDFVPGREQQIAALLDAREFDYVVGSVHFLGDQALDMEEFSVWEGGTGARSPEEVWERYFQTIAASARSRLYDIIAHPDLVKFWGDPRRAPAGDLRRYYEPAVEAFADSGVAVELSTAGLRKPAGELYPAPAFLELCVQAGIPVALSSDAHRPADVGASYEVALELLERLGVDELASFRGRVRTMAPLGAEQHAG